MFCCGGTECVRCAQQGLAVLLHVEVRQLGNARGLAHPIDSDYEDDGGHAGRGLPGSRGSGLQAASGILEYPENFLLDRSAKLLGIGELSMADLLAQTVKNLARSLDSQVGGDERGLEVVENRLVDRLFPFNNFLDALHQLGLGGSNCLLEALEKARLFLFFTRSEEAQRHRIAFYLEAAKIGKEKEARCAGVICKTCTSQSQSFPRKRESAPQGFGYAMSTDWIPAFAGMTDASKRPPMPNDTTPQLNEPENKKPNG